MAGTFSLAPATILQPPEAALTPAQLLAVFDRVMDASWLLPIKQPGPGYEILQAYASMWARVSQAAVSSLNVFTLSAQGGQLSQGFVEVSRASITLGAVTLKAGTIVTTSNGGRAFFTVDDAVFGAVDTIAHDAVTGQQSIPVIAAAADWQWNVPGQVNAANGDNLAGDVDTILLPIVVDSTGEINFDATLQVSNPVAISGGRVAVLDQLAADQGLSRQPGEGDVQLSLRMRAIPAAITPGSISAAIANILGPYGVAFTLQEPLGIGVLPPATGYSGILVGFMDADPLPVNGVVQPGAVGLWYFDQGLGPGLAEPVVGNVGAIGPSNESLGTSRAFFRVHIPWIGGVNPGQGFAFLGSTGVGSPTLGVGTDSLYPTQGSFANGAVPADDYPWPAAGFLAASPVTSAGSYDGAGASSPTDVVAGQIWDALTQPNVPGGGMVAGGVGVEIIVG